MAWTVPPLALVQLLGAAVAVALAAYAYRRRDRPGARWLVVVLVADTIWMLAAAVNYGTDSFAVSSAMLGLRYAGIPLVPVSLLLFALSYTGRDGWLTRRRRALLWAPAASTMGLALTESVYVS